MMNAITVFGIVLSVHFTLFTAKIVGVLLVPSVYLIYILYTLKFWLSGPHLSRSSDGVDKKKNV